MPRLPSLSSGKSKIPAQFRHAVSNLSDSDDDSNSHMPRLPSLSSGESKIMAQFQHAVLNLSDSDDDMGSGSSGRTIPDDESLKSSNSSGYRSWAQESNSSNTSVTLPSNQSAEKRTHSEDDDGNMSAKKTKKIEVAQEPMLTDTLVQRMMKKMGFQEGGGLGKFGQGRTAPIEQSKQNGRRGLGLVLADIDRSQIQYDPTTEVKEVQETPSWYHFGLVIDLTIDALLTWVVTSPKKNILDDETHFCDPEVLRRVLLCKSAFDKMPGEEMTRARNRSNPYELIKKGPYLNRAAMKMANMDSVFEQMFTNPVDELGNSLVGADELLYFADVCAGPGGFSEYILSRKKWRAKGFGFTLRGDCDFKLADFYAGPCESFEPYYGVSNDGDIYKSENIARFENHVYTMTNGKGVHFMMADGGFSVKGCENIQEIKSKRIYLCQLLVALSIVRPAGHFVCKFFDVFTPFSAGLIFLMSRCFKSIAIHKPNTSRPANSERYIICKWRMTPIETIRDYLMAVNNDFDKYGETSEETISEIVPVEILKREYGGFYSYLLKSNNELGKRQINSLAKILHFSEDETLMEEKQQMLKEECLKAWRVEIKARTGHSSIDPDMFVRKLLKNDPSRLGNKPQNVSNKQELDEFMRSIHDWRAVILGADPKTGNQPTFFLGTSHKKCYKFDQSKKRWINVVEQNFELELSPGTLLYGEIVPEVRGERRGQMTKKVLHIIDAHTLGDEKIDHLHYTDRMKVCSLYARALDRPTMNKIMAIRVKDTYELDTLEEAVLRPMGSVVMKNGNQELVVPLDKSGVDFYLPKGVMFLKTTKWPFIRYFSQSKRAKYYWAPEVDPKFDIERPKEASADFRYTSDRMKTWYMNRDEDSRPFNEQQFIKELICYVQTTTLLKKY